MRRLALAGLCLGVVACTSAGGGDGTGGGGGVDQGGRGGNGGGGVGGAGNGGSAGSTAGVAGSAAGSGGNAGVTAGSAGSTAGTGGGAGGRQDAGSAGMTGGAGKDAGTAGGSGAYGYDGPTRCAEAGVALCESFENGLDNALWTTSKAGDATIVVDTMHAARGTKALHVRTASGSGHAFITEKKTFPVTNKTFYARMFVYFGDALTTDGHFTLAEGAGTGDPGWIRFGGQFKSYGVGTDHGPSGDWTDRDNKMIQPNVWNCVEFLFKGDSAEFRVWWDDQERTALHTGVSRHPSFGMPEFTSLWFGWWMYNATEAQDLWIDEIAVDSKPIGCAR